MYVIINLDNQKVVIKTFFEEDRLMMDVFNSKTQGYE